MSNRTKSRFGQAAPFLTLALVVFIGLALFGIFSFLQSNLGVPDRAAIMPGAAVTPTDNTDPSPTHEASTEIPIPAPDEPTPTPIVIMGVPREVTPAPTYAVGPTAQFAEMLPLSEWHSYEDTIGGFSIQYPPDWYIQALPEEQRITGSTTSLYSYDPNDPNLSNLGKAGKWPTNFTKIEITLDRPELTGHPWNVGETISEWVRESTPLMDDVTMLQERTIFIDGIEAFHQVTQADNQHPWSVTYLHVGDYILYIAYPYEGGESFNSQVIDRIVNSIHIRR